jgi:hypothetical protein
MKEVGECKSLVSISIGRISNLQVLKHDAAHLAVKTIKIKRSIHCSLSFAVYRLSVKTKYLIIISFETIDWFNGG